ncbi:MAG: hypothetical protein AAF589_00045 [Planctomycetota bacterium]
MACTALLLPLGADLSAVEIAWQGGTGVWGDPNWIVNGAPGQNASVADDEDDHQIADQYVLGFGELSRDNLLTTVSPGGSWTQTGGTLNIGGGARLRFANGAATSSFSGGAVVNVGELSFGQSTVNIDGATFNADFMNVPGPNANTIVNVTSGAFNLSSNNALRGSSFSNHTFDLLGPAGSFLMTQSNNTNASRAADLAGKVAGGFFSIDGTKIDPVISTSSDWSDPGSLNNLNSELQDLAVGGKHLFVERTGGGVDGSEQRVTLIESDQPFFKTSTFEVAGDPHGIGTVAVDHRWFGYEAGRDRDFTGEAPGPPQKAYDYSVFLMKDGDDYRMFHGGRFRDQMPDGAIVDGDHVLSRVISSADLAADPSNWTDVTPTLYPGQGAPSPLFIQPRFTGDPDQWYSNNYLEPEVVKVNGTYYLYTQVQIDPGQLIDTGQVAAIKSDRIQLHTSTDGENWTRHVDPNGFGVIRNVTAPPFTDFGHQEMIYAPWDEDGRPYWMYVRHNTNGNFQGYVRIRSADPTAFEWGLRESTSGMAQLGNQVGYFTDYTNQRMFVRITFREDDSGREVPTLQVSRDGLSWSGTGLELSGSEDNLVNMNTYFLGMSTLDGTGQFEEIAQQTYRILYAATTSNGPGNPAIFDAEIGLGEMILRLPVPLQGDYNGDLMVDELDYEVWRSSFGSTTEFAADGNRDGVVDAADYTVWRDNLGMTPAQTTSIASAPEPHAACLLLIGGLLLKAGDRSGHRGRR